MTRTSLPPTGRTSSQAPSAEVNHALERYAQMGGSLERPEVAAALAALAEHAPALLTFALADVALVPDVLARPLHRGDDETSMNATFAAATDALEDGPALHRVLRRRVHRALVRIALREVERVADVDETSAEMAALAAAATDAAYRAARRTVEAKHGRIVDKQGAPIPFVVIGMGKLGGGELNLGSDVDLIFLYGTDEGRVGDGELTVHEAFRRVALRMSKALAEQTEDGFCFRLDHRLRPEGSQGPLVNSLPSAERYYESFGRPWERAAMVRARPVAGERALGEEFVEALTPFIYPRKVDRRIVDELRSMVERSRRELTRHPERDVKLCRGGIREAEFFVQALQLMFGGQQPELRATSTTRALRSLRSSGLLGHREAMQLGADWALLRRIEHRIHVWTGYQTHLLPTDGRELARFAASLGFDGEASFRAALDAARERVRNAFDSLDQERDTDTGSDPGIDHLVDVAVHGGVGEDLTAMVAEELEVADADEAASHLRRLAKNPQSPFGAAGFGRAPGLAPLLLREVRATAYPDAALRNLAEFFARAGGDVGYDRALLEQPTFTRRLVGLFGASATLSANLIGHPETLDALLGNHALPSAEAILEAHDEAPFDDLASVDEETLVAALRRRQRELTLRIGLAYVASECDLENASRRLSKLAEVQIDIALRYASAAAELRHGAPATGAEGGPVGICVVGMGKLGSRELGFGSDLDLAFFYGEDGETDGGAKGRRVTHAEHFGRTVQRLLRLLTTPDAEGRGYEVDTRLRPNGNRGPLVLSYDAFCAYHDAKSSDWERQALTRARFVAGDVRLGARMEQAFWRFAYDEPPPPAEAVANLRRRMELELGHERPGRYHVKYGYGGLVDVEFLAQFLAMKHGATTAVRQRETLAALRALVAIGVLTADEGQALRDAYDLAREVEQTSKLLDDHRDALIVEDGPVAERIARRLRMRDRDGLAPSSVLVGTWLRTAEEVRGLFERHVARVGTRPPWLDPADVA